MKCKENYIYYNRDGVTEPQYYTNEKTNIYLFIFTEYDENNCPVTLSIFSTLFIPVPFTTK